jgi:hypothetical protein
MEQSDLMSQQRDAAFHVIDAATLCMAEAQHRIESRLQLQQLPSALLRCDGVVERLLSEARHSQFPINTNAAQCAG